MDCHHAYVLALVQGVTEFLPISSSAHLILVPVLLGWPDQGLAFDVAVHIGTLLAVLVYYQHAVQGILVRWFGSLRGGPRDYHARLGWYLILGTIPAGLAGLAGKSFVETALRSPLVIAATTILFGLVLWLADRMGARRLGHLALGWRHALLIGIAQATALVPGVSRSGITLTAGLFLGFDRKTAADFSFLLSIPIIALAGGLKLVDLLQQPQAVDWYALLIGVAVSAVSAYLCIDLFLRWVQRLGLLPFVVYRLLLGAGLFYAFRGEFSRLTGGA